MPVGVDDRLDGWILLVGFLEFLAGSFEVSLHARDDLRVFRVAVFVLHFVGIFFQVVELPGSGGAVFPL